MRLTLTLLTMFTVSTLFATSASACPMKMERAMVAQNHFKKAQRAEKRGRHARALRYYKRAMYTERSKSKRFRAALALGRLAEQLGRTHDAATGYRRATVLRPRSAKAHRGLGIALLDKKTRKALTHLAKAAELGTKKPGDVLAAIAQAFGKQGKVAKARETLDKALKAGASAKRIKAARAVIPATSVAIATRN